MNVSMSEICRRSAVSLDDPRSGRSIDFDARIPNTSSISIGDRRKGFRYLVWLGCYVRRGGKLAMGGQRRSLAA